MISPSPCGVIATRIEIEPPLSLPVDDFASRSFVVGLFGVPARRSAIRRTTGKSTTRQNCGESHQKGILVRIMDDLSQRLIAWQSQLKCLRSATVSLN
jgi:hypothetical protein